MSFFRRNIGIDVGTSKAVAYLRGRGIIFHEPSVVALDYYNEKIIAVGEEAEALLGRTPGNVSLIKPIEEGVIANFEAAEHLLHYILKKSLGRSIIKPNAILSVPSHITQVQKRALMQACKNAETYKVFLINEVLASAFGIGIDIKDPLGQMIIDIGAGSVSIGVVAKGQVVLSVGRRISGENFNRAIKKFVADKYNLFIGEETTEKIKRTIASLSKEAEPKGMEVGGRSKLYGLPTKIMLNSNERNLWRTSRTIRWLDHRAAARTPSTTSPSSFPRRCIGASTRGRTSRASGSSGTSWTCSARTPWIASSPCRKSPYIHRIS